MAYTYNTLRNAVVDWVEDDSEELLDAFANITNLAEEQVIKDLNFSIFDQTATGTLASATLTKPSGYLSWVALFITVSGSQVLVEPKTWDYVQLYGGTGAPIYFAESSETTLTVAPVPTSQAYSLRYVHRPTALSTTTGSTTTWISANVPDVMFWQTVLQTLAFLKTDERVDLAKGFYADALAKSQSELSHLIRREYGKP